MIQIPGPSLSTQICFSRENTATPAFNGRVSFLGFPTEIETVETASRAEVTPHTYRHVRVSCYSLPLRVGGLSDM